MKKSGLLLTQCTKKPRNRYWGETTNFYEARAALLLKKEDRVRREKEKIIITQRNHELKNSTFFFLMRYLCYLDSFVALPIASFCFGGKYALWRERGSGRLACERAGWEASFWSWHVLPERFGWQTWEWLQQRSVQKDLSPCLVGGNFGI